MSDSTPTNNPLWCRPFPKTTTSRVIGFVSSLGAGLLLFLSAVAALKARNKQADGYNFQEFLSAGIKGRPDCATDFSQLTESCFEAASADFQIMLKSDALASSNMMLIAAIVAILLAVIRGFVGLYDDPGVRIRRTIQGTYLFGILALLLIASFGVKAALHPFIWIAAVLAVAGLVAQDVIPIWIRKDQQLGSHEQNVVAGGELPVAVEDPMDEGNQVPQNQG